MKLTTMSEKGALREIIMQPTMEDRTPQEERISGKPTPHRPSVSPSFVKENAKPIAMAAMMALT